MIRRNLPLAIAFLSLLPTAQAQEVDLATSYYHFALAKLADLEMRYSDSIAEFEKAILVDPSSAKIRVEFANTLFKARHVDRAISECQKAVELDPESAEPHFLLGQIYKSMLESNSGSMDQAIEEFRLAVQLDQSNYEALFYLGQLLFYNANYEESAAIFGRFIQLRPNIPKAYNYRAGALIKLGEPHGAIEVLEESLKLQSDSLENLDLLARLYEETQQYEKAVQTYQAAIEIAPTTELKYRAAVSLARLERFGEAIDLFREVVSEAPSEDSFKVELGKALEGNGNFAEAVETFQKVLERDPENMEAGYYLASSLRALGRRPEAIEQVRKLLKTSSSMISRSPQQGQHLEARFKSFLAVLYQESRQFDEAIALFRQVIDQNRNDDRARLGLIYALKDAGKIQESLSLSKELLALQPDDLDVLITRARILSVSGQLEPAVELLQKQIDKQPELGQLEEYYLAMSQLYAEHKMYSRAEQIVNAAMKRLPDNQRIRFQQGALLERQGKAREAEVAFQAILAFNPKHAAVLNYLGYMLADRGERLQEALGYVERALAIEPHNGAYLDSLGWVYFKLNRLEQAESNLVQAARINDSDPTIFEHLGDLYYKMGDYAKARAYYERSVLFAEDQAEREKVEGKLASLIKLLGRGQN